MAEPVRVQKPVLVLVPTEPTPAMIGTAWAEIRKAKQAAGIARLGPGLGVADLYRIMVAAAPPSGMGGGR